MIGSIPGTSGNQACLDACFAFPGCNAAIRINANGGCFFKSVDAATVATDPFKIGTSFLVCPGEETGVVSGGDGTGGGEVETGVVDGGGGTLILFQLMCENQFLVCFVDICCCFKAQGL